MIKRLLMYLGLLLNTFKMQAIGKSLESIKNYVFLGMISKRFRYLGKNVIIKRSSSFHDCDVISIGNNSAVGEGCVITAWKKRGHQTFNPSIEISSNVTIGDYCHITAVNSIVISDGCQLGKMITITDNSHGRTNVDELQKKVILRDVYSKGGVYIGKNVWIGDKATILPGVTIGDGCIVGANAVVVKSAPPYSVIVGNPAKIVKQVL